MKKAKFTSFFLSICLVFSMVFFLESCPLPIPGAIGTGSGLSNRSHPLWMWEGAQLIENNAGDSLDAHVAVDALGNALAVWHQFDGTTDNILANEYIAGTGWGTPRLISSGPSYYPDVAVNASGNAMAVWWQYDGTYSRLYAASAMRIDEGWRWGTARSIGTATGSLTSYGHRAQVAIDARGNAAALWDELRTAGSGDIYVNRYAAGGDWGAPQLIATDPADAYVSQVAFDVSGNAIAVWRQSGSIYADRYEAGTGWGTPQLIETGNGLANNPKVAFDASGNAVVVWWQTDGANFSIYANRYAVGSGWGTAQVIENSNQRAERPAVAIDASGNAIAAWSQSDGTTVKIFANRYAAGSGWGTAVPIQTDNQSSALPQVAVDASGNAVVVWQQTEGSSTTRPYGIYANRYVAGTGWGTPQVIENNPGKAYWPQIAVDASGNAIAVWDQFDGAYQSIYANRLLVRGWGNPQWIGSGAASVVSPQVAVDASGDAIAVWRQNYSIYANRYEIGLGWGKPQEIGYADECSPQVAVDASGNAIAVWKQGNSIYANAYMAGTGWGTPQLIETNTESANYPQVAVSASSGNAVAVWWQYDGTCSRVYANSAMRVGAGWQWSTAQLIGTTAGSIVVTSHSPEVAIDVWGNAFVVWDESGTSGGSIYANTYQPASGWGAPQLIENEAGEGYWPQVGIDALGNAIAVWRQNGSICANRYAAGSGWGTPQLIEAGAGLANNPQVVVDASGNAITVWWQLDGPTFSIYANRYAAGSGWGTAQLIETGTDRANNPQVAVDGSGNAMAVWKQGMSIYANRYAAGSGWSTAQLIETGTGVAENPHVAVDDSSAAIAVWWQRDGTAYNIYANRYVDFYPGIR